MKCSDYLVRIGILMLAASSAFGIEHVTVERDGDVSYVSGRIEVEAQDGGLLLYSRDGTLWALQPEEIVARKSDNEIEFAPYNVKELKQRVLKELPSGFSTHTTAHYVIFYNTSKAYAQWCGGLYERLHRGFYNYWRKRKITLHEPELPLIAIVFDSKANYSRFARSELKDGADSIVGYYSLRTNRVTTYDLTGRGDLRTAGGRPKSSGIINEVLSRPEAASTVATIIHEATHQLAYNSGLQTRYADNPLWLSEGLAIYFETPDLKSTKGWRGIGAVNRSRKSRFLADLPNRAESGALRRLLTDDEMMRDGKTAVSAYAESWALCYFLAKRKGRQFSAYLSELSELEPLEDPGADGRLASFTRHFGDLDKLDREFVRYIRGLR